MPLTEDCKLDVLRHLDYEFIGLYQVAQSGGTLALGNAGMRYTGTMGSLLYKLNYMRPVEEAKLTGVATGAIQFSGSQPVPGSTVTITLTADTLDDPISVTVTVLPAWANPGGLLQLSYAIANAFMLTPAFQAAGFWALADYGAGPFTQQKVATPIVSINAPATVSAFELTATYTGSTSPQIVNMPRPVAPYISFRTVADTVQIYGFIPILNYLEGAYGGATANLSGAKANETVLRSDELEQRDQQYRMYIRKMANYLGVPSNFQPAAGYNCGASW